MISIGSSVEDRTLFESVVLGDDDTAGRIINVMRPVAFGRPLYEARALHACSRGFADIRIIAASRAADCEMAAPPVIRSLHKRHLFLT